MCEKLKKKIEKLNETAADPAYHVLCRPNKEAAAPRTEQSHLASFSPRLIIFCANKKYWSKQDKREAFCLFARHLTVTVERRRDKNINEK